MTITKTTLLIAMCLVVVTTAYGAPTVLSVVNGAGQSDVLREGETVTIGGTGFGNGGHGAPIVWDDFETGSAGQNLTGWNLGLGGGTSPVYPQYSNTELRAGSSLLSGLMRTPGAQYNCSAYTRMGRKRQAYATLYCYIQRVSGPSSWNVKMFRMCGGYPYYKTGYPRLGVTLGLGVIGQETGSGMNSEWGVTSPEGRWVRWEYYLKLSDPVDTETGEAAVWIDMNETWHITNAVTMDSGAVQDEQGYMFLDAATLPFFVGNDSAPPPPADGPSEYRIYYDDVYIDDTQARVEIGDEPRWADCTRREIQVASSWTEGSPDEVVVTVNQGTLGLGHAYLYVVDENGVISNPENGYQVTIERSPSWLAAVIDRWQAGELTSPLLHRAIYWYIKGERYTGASGDPVADGLLDREDVTDTIRISGQD